MTIAQFPFPPCASSFVFVPCCVLVCSLLGQLPTLAATSIDPPPGSGSPTGTAGGGSRPLQALSLPPIDCSLGTLRDRGCPRYLPNEPQKF